MSMEAKLREYRALRRRKELLNSAKEKLEKSKEKLINLFVPNIFRNMERDKNEEVLLLEEEEPVRNELKTNLIMEEDPFPETSEEKNQESWRYFTIKWSLYTIIWVTLYAIFLKLQFGAVFFIVSILIGICLNTRTRPKKEGEVSAYSVFNQNCTSIDGTLKAEQFEKEIRFGAASVR
ncbi:SAYSvFN domain-containing protein 1 [Bicyclus anynana]|uniref:SAYSvFN domain-containing protein 1 n=1 Tax=Bicyclus anynana TaxID=110368 RepID=A0A6J1N740_BICAN|nr:SAYSvFN domain-containing protein 1 [Bicyclus anynana]